MADPITLTISQQNLQCLIQTAQFYQQITADQTNAPLIATLQQTLASNIAAGSNPPLGLPSVDAQSAIGQT